MRAFSLRDVDALRELDRKYSNYINELREVYNKIITYRIPIYVISTDEEDERTLMDMAEAFIRVNRYGVRIGNIELMLSYLGGEIGGEFVSRIRKIHDELEDKIGLDLQPLLRFLFSNLS